MGLFDRFLSGGGDESQDTWDNGAKAPGCPQTGVHFTENPEVVGSMHGKHVVQCDYCQRFYTPNEPITGGDNE